LLVTVICKELRTLRHSVLFSWEMEIGESVVGNFHPCHTGRLKYTVPFTSDTRRPSAAVRNKRTLKTKRRKVCLEEKITKPATVERIWFSRDNPSAVPLYCH